MLYKEVTQLNDEVMELIEKLQNPELTAEEQNILTEKLNAVAVARDYMEEQNCEMLCKAHQNCIADNEAIDMEIKRLMARKKSNNTAIEWYEKCLLEAVQAHDGKFTAGTFVIGTRKSTTVNVDEAIFNDDRFKTIKTEVKIDKMALKAALKDGESIEGAELIEKQNIAIK